MHLDRRFLVVLGVSLVWAMVVAGAFYRLAGSGGGRSRAASLKQVVTAIRPLAAGTMVERGAVTLRGVPENLVPAGAFARVEDVIDRPVIATIQADEAVVEARLAMKGSGAGLGPLIAPGMRAMSVRVNEVVGVAGFVLPGMRVDVLVTGHPPDRGDTETQTVLQNITVLSAGQTTQTDGKGQPILATVVTLLVSLGQAESLTLANSEGKIQLVLRNSTDRQVVATSGSRLHEIYGTAPPAASEAPPARVRRPAAPAANVAAPPVAEPPQLAPAAKPDQMIMMSGGARKVVVFEQEAK